MEQFHQDQDLKNLIDNVISSLRSIRGMNYPDVQQTINRVVGSSVSIPVSTFKPANISKRIVYNDGDWFVAKNDQDKNISYKEVLYFVLMRNPIAESKLSAFYNQFLKDTKNKIMDKEQFFKELDTYLNTTISEQVKREKANLPKEVVNVLKEAREFRNSEDYVNTLRDLKQEGALSKKDLYSWEFVRPILTGMNKGSTSQLQSNLNNRIRLLLWANEINDLEKEHSLLQKGFEQSIQGFHKCLDSTNITEEEKDSLFACFFNVLEQLHTKDAVGTQFLVNLDRLRQTL